MAQPVLWLDHEEPSELSWTIREMSIHTVILPNSCVKLLQKGFFSPVLELGVPSQAESQILVLISNNSNVTVISQDRRVYTIIPSVQRLLQFRWVGQLQWEVV